MNPTPREKADPRQQVLIWNRQAAVAGIKGRFITALHYYSRALNRARDHQIGDLRASICRDLGYIYLHHGELKRARELFEEGLSVSEIPFETRFGLLANLVSATLLQREYGQALAYADQAIDRFERLYPAADQAPPELVVSFFALQGLQRKIAQFNDLIESGIDPRRLELSFKLAPPPWKR